MKTFLVWEIVVFILFLHSNGRPIYLLHFNSKVSIHICLLLKHIYLYFAWGNFFLNFKYILSRKIIKRFTNIMRDISHLKLQGAEKKELVDMGTDYNTSVAVWIAAADVLSDMKQRGKTPNYWLTWNKGNLHGNSSFRDKNVCIPPTLLLSRFHIIHNFSFKFSFPPTTL